MVLVYLPTKLGDFVRANVGVHIPAPWSIWLINRPKTISILMAGFSIPCSQRDDAAMPPGFFALLGAPTAR